MEEIRRLLVSDKITLELAIKRVDEHRTALMAMPKDTDGLHDDIAECTAYLRRLKSRQRAERARDEAFDQRFGSKAEQEWAKYCFERFTSSAFGNAYRFKTGMESVVGTEDQYLWVASVGDIENYIPTYYHSDIAARWQTFLAGYLAVRGKGEFDMPMEKGPDRFAYFLNGPVFKKLVEAGNTLDTHSTWLVTGEDDNADLAGSRGGPKLGYVTGKLRDVIGWAIQQRSWNTYGRGGTIEKYNNPDRIPVLTV